MYPVPADIDKEIARLKLAGMGMSIDKLTKEQVKYLASGGNGNLARTPKPDLELRGSGRPFPHPHSRTRNTNVACFPRSHCFSASPAAIHLWAVSL